MKLSITQRLGFGFGSVISLIIIITVAGIVEVRAIDHDLTEITDVNAVAQRYAINLRGSVHDRAIRLRDVVLHREAAGVRRAMDEIATLTDFYTRTTADLDKLLTTLDGFGVGEREALARIKAVEARTLPQIDRVIELRNSGRGDEALSLLLQQAAPSFTEWLAAINVFIDIQGAENQVATEHARETAAEFARLMLVLCGIAILLGTIVATLIARSLVRSLGGEPEQAAHMVRSIANGDLTSRIHTRHPESMLGAMGSMQGQLSSIFGEMGSIASSLVAQSETLGKSAREVSEQALKQTGYSQESAEKIDHMAAGMDEIVALARRTEENSRKTTELSEAGIALVERAGAEMSKIAATVATSSEQISNLRQGSEKISGAAGVIREIADQTNLLALNAAIEAARAGETGRGFAVVADEVRKLAERTSLATSEIAEVIKVIERDTQKAADAMATAVPQVDKGLELSEQASRMLSDINRQATDSLTQAAEVVRTTDAQHSSIQALSSNFRQVTETAEQVASQVTNNVRTAADLERIASVMREHTSRFRLARA